MNQQVAEEESQSQDSIELSKGSEKKTELPISEEEEDEEGEEPLEKEKPDDPMEEDSVSPATVFCIRLKQPRSNLQHKMSVPELCRNFRPSLIADHDIDIFLQA
nr:mediator of rna polymerase ii transcription subunit 16 [Quercus suber]